MSVVLEVHLGPRTSIFTCDGASWNVPVGSETLSGMIASDPPSPEELTNAIGLLVDHLDDVTREVPAADLADEVHLHGLGIAVLAAVEVGAPVSLPYVLGRRSAEELFRTLVTESAAERVHNPELPSDHVQTILGTACASVAILRGLDRPQLVLVESP